jgi:hypothetical protein
MTIEIANLREMLHMEIALDSWWKSLNPTERTAYLKAHPASRYGKAHESGANLSGHMEKRGFTKTGRNTWEHKNGVRVRMRPSDTHKYHIEVTHPNGDVHTRRTNSGNHATAYLTHIAGGMHSDAKPSNKKQQRMKKIVEEKPKMEKKIKVVREEKPQPSPKMEKAPPKAEKVSRPVEKNTPPKEDKKEVKKKLDKADKGRVATDW